MFFHSRDSFIKNDAAKHTSDADSERLVAMLLKRSVCSDHICDLLTCVKNCKAFGNRKLTDGIPEDAARNCFARGLVLDLITPPYCNPLRNCWYLWLSWEQTQPFKIYPNSTFKSSLYVVIHIESTFQEKDCRIKPLDQIHGRFCV